MYPNKMSNVSPLIHSFNAKFFPKNQHIMFNQDELSAVERLTAPTPKFQQNIQIIAILLGIIGAALMKVQENGIDWPVWVSWIGSKITIISSVVATLIAQFSVDYKEKAAKEALSNIK
jgi:hypothetical protein